MLHRERKDIRATCDKKQTRNIVHQKAGKPRCCSAMLIHSWRPDLQLHVTGRRVAVGLKLLRLNMHDSGQATIYGWLARTSAHVNEQLEHYAPVDLQENRLNHMRRMRQPHLTASEEGPVPLPVKEALNRCFDCMQSMVKLRQEFRYHHRTKTLTTGIKTLQR